MNWKRNRYILLLMAIVAAAACLPWQTVMGQGSPAQVIDAAGFQADVNSETYPLMHPTSEQLAQMQEHLQSLSSVTLNEGINESLAAGELEPSVDLLPYLQYNPHERDQGQIGNCWVWAGTGLLEIALNKQMNIKDRLSIQYLDSNYNGGLGSGWAGYGGELSYLVKFYNNNGKAVPWSNTNADYQDQAAGDNDPAGSSVKPWEIGNLPYYPVYKLQEEVIPTNGVDNATAILNIKNVLHQGKAVWFAFYMSEMDDWYSFMDFWAYQSESAVWNPNYSLGQTWDDGAGHAVLCVGYHDEPGDSYWVMLNSWGDNDNRPNGLFRLDMDDLDYSGIFYNGSEPTSSFCFETVEVDFPFTATGVSTGRADSISSSSAVLRGGLPDMTRGKSVLTSFEYGLTPVYGSQTAWQIQNSTRAFSSKLTGLSPAATYYYRARAYDLYTGTDLGYSSGSSFTTSPRSRKR